MKKILEELCLPEGAKGLLLMSPATGSGKTHKVLDFIFEHHSTLASQGRKIIFITNLKKNLPIGDLEQRFAAAGIPQKFSQNVLFINSNQDTVIENFPKVINEIPDQFKKDSFNHLKGCIEALNSGGRLPANVRETIRADLRKSAEPGFRKYIAEHLSKEFKTKKDRLNAIKNKKNYQWIGRLYPTVFTDEKTVLFMSVDKFFRKNTTLIEKSYYFAERFGKNSLIFIDEFDATKDSLLQIIIEGGIRHRVTLLDLFLNIHSYLDQSECPEILLQESEKRKRLAQEFNWLSLRELVANFKEIASRIFTKYDLQHTCKSHSDFSRDKRNFLFYDYQFHHVLDTKGKKIELVSDPKRRANWIKALNADAEINGADIRSLLGELSGFLKYFQRGIGYLADNYCQLKSESSESGESFPLEAAVRTVLSQFRLDEADTAFFVHNIMEGAYPYDSKARDRNSLGQYFYDIGFRYHDIVDHDDHDTLSKVYMYNFSQTPEAMLAGICSQAMVVGVSATAGLHTNIGNYDLEYLKYQLGENFHELRGSDISRLKRDFEKATRGYDEIDLRVKFLGPPESANAFHEIAILMDDQEAAEALHFNIVHANPEADEKFINFMAARYLRALLAWKYFIETPELSAQLCLFNLHAKPENPFFDLNILRQYAGMLLEDATPESKNNDIDETFVVLTGDDFETQKGKILSDLAAGKRLFVLSAYQTIGAGQNLQYSIPETADPVHINSFPKRSKMDFDAIYMDRPTNLIVNLGTPPVKENDFIKYLFQLEFLVENGAMGARVFKSKLNQAFHRYVGGEQKKIDPFEFFNLFDTAAYIRFANKVLIQATGRICRTNMKAKTIHVLADSSVRKCLQGFTLPESVIPVREYSALLEKAKEEGCLVASQVEERQNRASAKSDQVAAEIQRLIRSPWSKETMEMWKALRLQVLRFPVISEPERFEKNWAGIYLDLGSPGTSYQYSQKGDYGETEIYFGHTDKKTQEVSEISSRLRELMKIPGLLAHFRRNGLATEFTPGRLMLLPPIFNNIYKGALGEECGQFLLKEFLNISLLELGLEEFEKFDFKTAEGIYVDFKLWNDNYGILADKVIPNILQKAQDCNAKRVFIINILASNETRFRPVSSNDGLILEIPYLIKGEKLDPEALSFLRREFSR